MTSEEQIREKLRKISALFEGATTIGERNAAAAAIERVKKALGGMLKSEQPEEGLAVARNLGHPWNLAVGGNVADLCKLRANRRGRAFDQRPVCRGIEPAARSRRVRERDHNRALVLVTLADAFGDALQAEQPSYR